MRKEGFQARGQAYRTSALGFRTGAKGIESRAEIENLGIRLPDADFKN